MTDADILSRISAQDSDGLTIAWTPEYVQLRLIEAASVFARIPATIGPARCKSAWPVFVRTAEDLIDDQTQQRLMRFPHLVGNWEARIDDTTKRHLSRDVQEDWERRPINPGLEAVSRAEEALFWPLRYLGDKPLHADALTLWAFCIGTGTSLRASLRARVERAAEKGRLLPGSRRQEVMPGKNFNRQALHERRKAAASIVSAALIADRVLFRAPDDVDIDGGEE